MNKYFNIYIEPKLASPVFEGTFNKDNEAPEGAMVEVQPQLGAVYIPNYSRVWAKRVDFGKPAWKGELEFLKWGTDGGEAVEIRFLETSRSLDKQYQENNLKLKVDDDVAQIELKPGLNEIDEDARPTFARFLRAHSFFGGNISKNPLVKRVVYVEYTASARIENRIETLRKSTEANKIVLESIENKTITVLAAFFDLDVKTSPDILQEQLLNIVANTAADKRTPGHDYFLNTLRRKKNEVGTVLTNALEKKYLKGKEGGVLTMMDGTGADVEILEDKLQDGASTYEFFLSNILKEEFYNAYQTVERTSLSLDRALAD